MHGRQSNVGTDGATRQGALDWDVEGFWREQRDHIILLRRPTGDISRARLSCSMRLWSRIGARVMGAVGMDGLRLCWGAVA